MLLAKNRKNIRTTGPGMDAGTVPKKEPMLEGSACDQNACNDTATDACGPGC